MENKTIFKRRLLALLIDYLLILAWGLLLFVINILVYFFILGGIPTFNELGMNLMSLTMIAPVLIYSILSESSVKQATFGKEKMKLRVVSTNLKRVKPWQSVIRNLVKFLPWQFAHMMMFRVFSHGWTFPTFWSKMLIVAYILPFLWVASVTIRNDHRGIHDLFAKTTIINSLEVG